MIMRFTFKIMAVLAICVPGLPQARAYTLTDLGTLGGNTLPQGINSSGTITGRSNGSNGTARAFVWIPNTPNGAAGVLSVLALSRGATYANGMAINDAGAVAGTAGTGGSSPWEHASLWKPGASPQDLGVIRGNQSDAYGLNNSGAVVGWTDISKSGPLQAFLWQNGTMKSLGTLDGSASTSGAYGVNDSLQVVGFSDSVGHSRRAFLWQNGKMTDLGGLPGGTGATASAINTSGWVVGQSDTSNTGYVYHANHACLWQSANVATDLQAFGDFNLTDSSGFPMSQAYGINNPTTTHGVQAVGYGSYDTIPGNGSSRVDRAFVWDNLSGMQDLNKLVVNPVAGLTLTQANAINDAGEIIGTATDITGRIHGFLLTP